LSRRRRLLRASAIGALVTILAGVGAHVGIRLGTRLRPPPIELQEPSLVDTGAGVRRVGSSTHVRHGKLHVVHLTGSPEQIGWAHARLLRDRMIENEAALLGELRSSVRPAPLRWLLLDLAQLRYRHVDRGMDDARRRELSASARAFEPDPYVDFFPTYQRFVYLNALYDIALSFEHSPLIGCTTFTFGKEAAEGGHPLLARAFDFDVHDIFDQEKAVFFVREDGKLPFASVAWPGLPGVVSGMNREGLALVVHGARAGEPRTIGEPVAHALRRVLGSARDVDAAVRAFAERDPMVSHLVIAADQSGRALAIERVPGAPPHARELPSRAAVTNHFEGPFAGDPKNQRVRNETTTLARAERGQELVTALSTPATVADAVRLLRDKRGPGGAALPAGDRRAIDANIATHGVVFDCGQRRLWVSEAPHLAGRFVAFDLEQELGDAPPAPPVTRPSLPADSR
jgi:hypothetical protein